MLRPADHAWDAPVRDHKGERTELRRAAVEPIDALHEGHKDLAGEVVDVAGALETQITGDARGEPPVELFPRRSFAAAGAGEYEWEFIAAPTRRRSPCHLR